MFIVKSRARTVRTWWDWRGVSRRVKCWSPWKRIQAFPANEAGAADAAILIFARRKSNTLEQLAVFYRGKVVTELELRHWVTGEVSP